MRTQSSSLHRQSASFAAGNLSSFTDAVTTSAPAAAIQRAVDAVLLRKTFRWQRLAPLSVALMALAGATAAHAQSTPTISISTLGNSGTYNQNFSGLSTAGTSGMPVIIALPQNTQEDLSNISNFSNTTDAAASIAGWYGAETGGSANEIIYATDNGAGTRGSIYNYNSAALGTLASGTAIFEVGALFTNTTGSTITSITISFTGEEWRNGGSGNTNTLTFGYGVGASSIAGSGFTADTSLNYADTVHGTTAAALDGTQVANQVAITATITGLTWTNGSTLAIRWADANDAGNDDGIAIAKFALTAFGSGIASQYWDPNGAAGIGGSGTWDTTSSLWNPNSTGSGTQAVFSSASNTVFGGTGGTVTIAAGGVTANAGLEFSSGGYMINGPGILTLGSGTGGNTISVDNAGDTATINAQISGSSGLVKVAAGTLVLGNAANNFTGGVQINGGAISISADGQLGSVSNDVALGGGSLITTASIMTNRNFSGTGGLSIASGKTLTVNGNFNTTGLTLTNSGTLDLEGGTSTVGVLTFSAPGTLTSSGNIVTASGLDATNLNGKATINLSPSEGLNLGSGTVTVNVGASGDLALNTPVALAGSGNSSLKKTGTGDLELLQDNADVGLFRVQIGSAGVNGGTVIINNPLALGISQFFLNGGTLQASADLTGANAINGGVTASNAPLGVSIGGLDTAPAIFAGSNMEFDGASDIFQASSAASHITVNNTTILGGLITVTGTAFSAPKLTIDGTGTLVFTEDASGMTLPTTVAGSATLYIQKSAADSTNPGGTGAWASNITVSSSTAKLHVGATAIVAGTVNVTAGALIGTGTLAGVTVGDGSGSKDSTISPGEPGNVGTMAVSSLSLNSDAVFQLTLNTTAKTNSFLSDTGALTLTGSPVLSLLDINPSGSALPLGTQFAFLQYSTFGGGQFSDLAGDSLTEGAKFGFGANEYQISYAGGASHNEVVLTTVVVPEPSAIVALAWGCAAMAGIGRFRRKARPAC